MIRSPQTEKSPKEMLQLFASMLKTMLPSCSHVLALTNCRVPIIKFKDTDTGCDCDLNMSTP